MRPSLLLPTLEGLVAAQTYSDTTTVTSTSTSTTTASLTPYSTVLTVATTTTTMTPSGSVIVISPTSSTSLSLQFSAFFFPCMHPSLHIEVAWCWIDPAADVWPSG